MKNKIEELSKYVTTIKCENEYKLMFVDFNYDTFQPELINVSNELNKTDISIAKDLILEKILELSNKNEDSEKFSIKKSIEGITDELMISRKVCSKILNGCNYIAANGRIGSGNTILISEENYNKYELSRFDFENVENVPDKMNREVIFDESINDIILYRKNDIEQPGLVLLYSDDKYDIIDIGIYPEKQFLKIEL